MNFRRTTIEDLEEIYKLYRLTIESEAGAICLWDDNYPDKKLIKEDVVSDGGYCLEDENGIIVAACYAGSNFPVQIDTWKYPLKNPAYFGRLVVDLSRHGQGIGKQMVQCVINQMEKLGFDGIRGFVVQQNKTALKLYAGFGFESTHISDAFNDGVELFVHEYSYAVHKK